MANSKHLKILKQGVEIWNRWRNENPNEKTDLSQAIFFKAAFVQADPSEANVYRADLSKANLKEAIFGGQTSMKQI